MSKLWTGCPNLGHNVLSGFSAKERVKREQLEERFKRQRETELEKVRDKNKQSQTKKREKLTELDKERRKINRE